MTKQRFVIAGTDTGVGKTVFSATLAGAIDACYWKPVQAGAAEETDSQAVLRLSGLAAAKILPEAYVLSTPCSPHLAASIDGVAIDADSLTPPDCDGAFVIETAGGLMTPLTNRVLTIDVLARWNLPVILCARTTLGTINHSLLSLEALRTRNVPVFGVAFVGEENENTQRTIVQMGKTRELGRLPLLSVLTPETLRFMFDRHFRIADFTGEAAT